MKAFLSHSSVDKEFVRAVAKTLGRPFCIFDEQTFETGTEFKLSIEEGLSESDVFVLFASSKALESLWVNFEIEGAWYKKLEKKISKSLVYIIDSSIDLSDIPEWLKKGLIRQEFNSPQLIARDIKYHIEKLLREKRKQFFVGRRTEIEKAEESLTPVDGSVPPHILCFYGLPGIGRRALAKKVAESTLSLKKQVELRISEGDDLTDLCLIIADKVEPYSTKEGLRLIAEEIRSLPKDELITRTITNIRKLVQIGELPILVDEGGLLDNDGSFIKFFKDVLSKLSENDSAYLFAILKRKPQDIKSAVKINRLNDEDTKRLIIRLASNSAKDLKIDTATLSKLARYSDGYPPAIYFSIQHAENYGLATLTQNVNRLTKFRSGEFIRHMSKIAFDDLEKDILKILAEFSPLPLESLADALHANIKVLSDKVIRLLDCALLQLNEEGYYRIADPIRDVISSMFDALKLDTITSLAYSLSEYLDGEELELPKLELSRVLFRASKASKRADLIQDVVYFASDLISLTQTLYHARDYEKSVQFGLEALEMRPKSNSAREYLTRSLIKLEKWKEADEQISLLSTHAPMRDVFFLRGFLARNMRDHASAIESYEQSKRLGRKGAAINRELANSYLRVRNYQMANKYIQDALDRHGDNPYVVDLWAQIATSRGDEQAARQALASLKQLNMPVFYHHRKSRIEYIFGHCNSALKEAKIALEQGENPVFEVISQLINCEIECGDLDKADELLTKLDARNRNRRFDIRLDLRCRLFMKRGNFKDALILTEKFKNKDSFYYKRARKDALYGEIEHSALNDNLRIAYREEHAELENELKGIPSQELALSELDDD